MFGTLFDDVSTGTMITALAVLVLMPFVYYAAIFAGFVRRVRKIGRVVDQFPGPPKHWLMGTLHEYPGPNDKGMEYSRGIASQHPRVFRGWIGPFVPVLNVYHPDTVKIVLRSSEPKQMSIGGYSFLHSWLVYLKETGDGLLLASGRKWQRNRRLLTPAFHFDVLRPYMDISNEAADIFLDKLAVSSKSGESVEISKPICLLTLNIILRCAFSYDADVQREGESHPYVNSVLMMAKLLIHRLLSPYLYADFIYGLTPWGKQYKKAVDHVHNVSGSVIEARQKTLKQNPGALTGKKSPDFLDILLLAKDGEGKGLTDIEIRNEVDTFMFEGHDTTASAISWILYTLAKHPEHQEECRHEVDRLLEGRDSTDILWDDLQEIPHLTMCIKEAMRLNPPVPFFGREVKSHFELEGIALPKGTCIIMSAHLIHTNETVWGDDALEFKPERFHHDRMKNMDPFAYVPFAAGPRNCIGQNFAMHEIKVVVAKVLRRFEMSVDPKHEVSRVIELVMRAKDGIKLYLTTRV